jgi:C4-dicarboxylate-specific signal transduction histidine kinase
MLNLRLVDDESSDLPATPGAWRANQHAGGLVAALLFIALPAVAAPRAIQIADVDLRPWSAPLDAERGWPMSLAGSTGATLRLTDAPSGLAAAGEPAADLVGSRGPGGDNLGGLPERTKPAALAQAAVATAWPVPQDGRPPQSIHARQDLAAGDGIGPRRDSDAWTAYGDRVIPVAAVVLIQATMIAALLFERRARRRTAGELAASEARMNLATRAAGLSTWMWDLARSALWPTPGQRRDPRPGGGPPIRFAQVLERVHPADRQRLEDAVRDAFERGDELDIEYRVLDGDGDVRWVSSRGRAAGGSGYLTGVSLDITARKQAELQADKDRVVLTHMTRVSMLGQLSASIAHQLNQPLTAILGNAEAARRMLDRDPLDRAELKDICDDIIAEDVRAVDIMRKLAELYKRGEMQVCPLNLNDLVIETLELVRTELMSRHVLPILDLAPQLPLVEGGRVQLQQVLLNLILNAADAMAETEIAQRRLVIHTGMQGDAVVLSVADRGTGIAPQDLPNVFDAFWSTKASGLGIGLAVCQSIITAHHGRLGVVNNPDGGATFTATWPARQAP